MCDPNGYALAFAKAISRDGRALLIEADNRSSGWTSVGEAVASGQAYAVELRAGLVALDLDSESDHAWAGAVRQSLPDGFRFVRTESGRTGHGHLWIIAPPGWTQELLKLELQAGGMSNLPQTRSNATRPPYSPHRSGMGRSIPVEPDPATALDWFRSVAPRDLSPEASAYLRTIDPAAVVQHHRKPARGLTLSRVASSAVHARWDFDRYAAVVAASAGYAATKYHEKRPDEREDYLKRLWSKAMEFARDNPALSPASVARTRAARMRAAMRSGIAWDSRTGASDKAVYLAMLQRAERLGRLEVALGVRQLSELTGLSKPTISRSMRRLIALGLISPASNGAPAPFDPASFRLCGPQAKAEVDVSTYSHPRGSNGFQVDTYPAEFTDLFTNSYRGRKGLGVACRDTWEALTDDYAKTAEVCARRVGNASVAACREHLRRLNEVGLAERQGYRWRRITPSSEDLQRLAELLGVGGATANRIEVHRDERAAYRDWRSDRHLQTAYASESA